jgi:hypothetical protein
MVSVAVEVVRNHWQQEEVVRLGCELLLHLVYDSPIHRDRLRDAKQVKTLLGLSLLCLNLLCFALLDLT